VVAIAQADIADLGRVIRVVTMGEVAANIARFQAQRRVTFRLRLTSFHDHLDG
jgi:hypothetical protein